MKYPYGICDFRRIVTKGYFYCDRTDRIPQLERGEYLLFLRPRRSGKSLLLSMLSNYYDVAKKDEFDSLFGNLKIGKDPTPLRNRYFILQWDFSCVESYGDVEQIRRALHDHINACIIYLEPEFNDMCGFTDAETDNAVKASAASCGLKEAVALEPLDMMRSYYDGYKFSPDAEESVYNPTLVLYFLDAFHKTRSYPRKMLDANLAMDSAKLEFISQIQKGGQLILNLMKEDRRTVVEDLADRFGIRQMLAEQSKDYTFMVSFLYYFGVLTIDGLTEVGEIALAVPNLVMQKLYVERLLSLLLPEPADRDDGTFAAKKLYQQGEMGPVCEFVEQRYFKVFHNRDYQWANELTVKTAFLNLLYNDILYVMDSETEADRRYADLTMIIRPDMRKYSILDILVEFTFVTLKESGLSGEQARKLSQDELHALPQMIGKVEDAKVQVKSYGETLEKRHGNLRLRKFAVVSLGFDRIWWEDASDGR